MPPFFGFLTMGPLRRSATRIVSHPSTAIRLLDIPFYRFAGRSHPLCIICTAYLIEKGPSLYPPILKLPQWSHDGSAEKPNVQAACVDLGPGEEELEIRQGREETFSVKVYRTTVFCNNQHNIYHHYIVQRKTRLRKRVAIAWY